MYPVILANPFSSLLNFIGGILGEIINIFFEGLKMIGIPNIGLAIILFTLCIYILMLPSTIKQQKFSKLSAKMQPEIQAVQKKYKGKNDQVSMMKMNDETKAIYDKYGASPSGGCLQMLITLPVFFAMYRVIYNVPKYVDSIGAVFSGVVGKIKDVDGYAKILENFADDNKVAYVKNVQEFLYKLNPDQLDALSKVKEFDGFSGMFADLANNMEKYNNFLWMNISFSPYQLIQAGVYAAILIPVLAGLFQWLTTKLMPQAAAATNGDDNTMASTMKSMNTIMPIFSIVICFSMPVSMGLYWVAGGIFRCLQQLVINKKMNSIDVDELIKQNIEKANKKREKRGLPPQQITSAAKVNTKAVDKKEVSAEERQEEVKKSTDYYNSGNMGKPGSIRAKANMVRQYNEKNNK